MTQTPESYSYRVALGVRLAIAEPAVPAVAPCVQLVVLGEHDRVELPARN